MPKKKKSNKMIRYAGIAEIIILVMIVPLIILELLRGQEKLSQGLFYLYIFVFLIYSALYIFNRYGFVLIARKTKQKFLLTMSKIFIVLSIIYVPVTIFLPQRLENPFYLFSFLFIAGILYILWGMALLRLKEKIKGAFMAGLFNIIIGAAMATIIFGVVFLILVIPTIIFEIILLFQAAKKLR